MIVSTNAEVIKKSFTEQAKNFETKSMSFTKQEYLKHIISCIKPQKTDTVLEVAAGTCACGRSLAPLVQNVTCLDITTPMLAVGKFEAEKQNLRNMIFVQGDAERLPFLASSFDIVLSRLAFHHFLHPHLCFMEMSRVLRPNGKLVLIDMEASEDVCRDTKDQIEMLRDPSHVRNLSKGEFLELFAENELTVQTIDCTDIPVSLNAWLALTNTSAEIAANITNRFTRELRGEKQTGFMPYETNEGIYFKQRWLLIIGQKGKGVLR